MADAVATPAANEIPAKVESKPATQPKAESKSVDRPAKPSVATKEKVQVVDKTPTDAKSSKQSFVAVLIRGTVNIPAEVKATLQMLHLHRKHSAVIVPDTTSYRGMLQKCKDFITFGEVDTAVVSKIEQSRKPRKGKNGTMTFSLHPPIGGFERKGIKISYNQGGALGYRAHAINDLIQKML